MYSYIKDNQKEERTAKGIKKNIIKNNMKHEDYKKTLLNEEQMHHKMKTIRSQKHQLGSYELNRCRSAVSMISATSMIMEQVVMLMDTTKYKPPYFWTRYRSSLLLHISASIVLDKI